MPLVRRHPINQIACQHLPKQMKTSQPCLAKNLVFNRELIYQIVKDRFISRCQASHVIYRFVYFTSTATCDFYWEVSFESTHRLAAVYLSFTTASAMVQNVSAVPNCGKTLTHKFFKLFLKQRFDPTKTRKKSSVQNEDSLPTGNIAANFPHPQLRHLTQTQLS